MRAVIIIFLFLATTVQAEEVKTLKETNRASRTSSYSFTEGTIGNRTLKTESIHMEEVTITQGSLGSKPVNTSTIRIGNIQLTTGTVGSEAVSTMTITPRKRD